MKLSRFVPRFFIDCWTLVVPTLIVLVVTLWLFASGRYRLARAVADLGAFIVVLANVVYIVAWHSRKRWPGTTWRVRLAKLVTSQR